MKQQTTTIVAEGQAALKNGDRDGAQRAAIAIALRRAVEKTLGVYVSAQTLTQNFVLVRDQVLARSEGHAVLNEVVREELVGQELRVIIKATVSLRPLTDQVRALGLARTWRVFAEHPLLERELAQAGFVVVEEPKQADLRINITPLFTTTAQLPLETSAGPLTMYTLRGEITVRALRGTEVIHTRTGTETARHIRPQTAQSQILDRVLQEIAPRIVEDLLVLPSRLSQPVQLTVQGVPSAQAAQLLGERLAALSGVLNAQKRSWSPASALFELEVPTETSLASGLKSLGLFILSESKTQIRARNLPPKRRVFKT